MKTEVEAKFLGVDFNEMRRKLGELGGVCEQPMRLMRRVIIEPDFLERRDAFIRVRDEGDRVTLTFKEFVDNSLSGAREREVVVSDFDETVEILKSGGLEHRSYQESRRETWRLGEVEIVLDQWPWINDYIEIEAPSEELVKQMADRLGLVWSDAVFGSVDTIYKRTYPNAKNRGVIDIKEVRFTSPSPKELGERV